MAQMKGVRGTFDPLSSHLPSSFFICTFLSISQRVVANLAFFCCTEYIQQIKSLTQLESLSNEPAYCSNPEPRAGRRTWRPCPPWQLDGTWNCAKDTEMQKPALWAKTCDGVRGSGSLLRISPTSSRCHGGAEEENWRRGPWEKAERFPKKETRTEFWTLTIRWRRSGEGEGASKRAGMGDSEPIGETGARLQSLSFQQLVTGQPLRWVMGP